MADEKLTRAVNLRLTDSMYKLLESESKRTGFRMVSSYIRSVLEQAIQSRQDRAGDVTELRLMVQTLHDRVTAMEHPARGPTRQKDKGGTSGPTKTRMERAAG